jgi:hypothetical protein
MKRVIKSIITAVLSVAVTVSVTAAGTASAALFPGIRPLQGAIYANTPAGTVMSLSLSKTAGTVSATADFTLNDYQSFVRTVEQEFLARVPTFTVRYNASRSNTNAALNTLMDDVFAYDDPSTTSGRIHIRS